MMNSSEPSQTNSISFVLHSGITAEQRERLRDRWTQQGFGGHIVFVSEVPTRSAWRVGHIKVTERDVAEVLSRISSEPEVESAEIESPRRLA